VDVEFAELRDDRLDLQFGLGHAVAEDVDVGAQAGEFQDLFVGGEFAAILEDQAEDDIAHAEAHGGRGWAAEEFDEVVVATAAGDCALGSAGFVDFEDHAGVVREAAHDGEIEVDPVDDTGGDEFFGERQHGLAEVREVNDMISFLAGGKHFVNGDADDAFLEDIGLLDGEAELCDGLRELGRGHFVLVVEKFEEVAVAVGG